MSREEIIVAINESLGGFYGTMDEITSVLSDMFADKCDEFEDAQEAFNDLNDDIGDDILSNYFCYCLSDGGEWTIEITELNEEMVKALKNNGIDINDIDGLISYLERKIEKCMSNVGCDARTALSLELEDFPSKFEWEDIIYINVPEGSPIIEFIDDMIV